MTPLQALKVALRPNACLSVTNHYILRKDHCCFGTVQRTVTEANTSSWAYIEPTINETMHQKWPKASSVKVSKDGQTFSIYDYPRQGDLFLTIEVVS